MTDETDFEPLIQYLKKGPAIVPPIGSGASDEAWWAKFGIEVDHVIHPWAWRVVQELGHVVNYVSLNERLPTVFMPVSPPPYMNGGPKDFLSWIIKASDMSFTPADCAEWLEGRLPRPVDDLKQWEIEED